MTVDASIRYRRYRAPERRAASYGVASESIVGVIGALYIIFCFVLALSLNIGILGVPLLATVALIVGIWAPRFSMILLVVSIIFQNVVVTLLSGITSDPTAFTFSQAANYIVLIVLFAALMAERGDFLSRRTGLVWLLMGALLLWTLYGITRSSAQSAAQYFRLFSVPLLTIMSAIYIRPHVNIAFMSGVIALIAGLVIFLCFFEVFFQAEYYNFFNIVEFQIFKRPDRYELQNIDSLIDSSTRSLLNFTGEFRLNIYVPKIYGPALHTISSAYIIANLALATFFLRRYVLTILLAVLLVMFSAKGPLFLFLIPVSMSLFARTGLIRTRGAMSIVLTYIAVVLTYGIYTVDVHVMGLIKGITSVAVNPVGAGIGVGGNLSDLRESTGSMLAIKSNLPFAVESGVGVLLYQMGIVGLLVLVALGRIVTRMQRSVRPEARVFFLCYWLMLLSNALFQEEALAPTAFGLGALVIILLMPLSDGRKDVVWH